MNTSASNTSGRRLKWILGLITLLAAVIAVSAAALSDDPDGASDAARTQTETTGAGGRTVPAPDPTDGTDLDVDQTTSAVSEDDASEAAPTTVRSYPSDADGRGDTADTDDAADNSPETSTVPDMDPESSDVTIPDASIPDTDEQTTCAAILDQLGEYRDLATSADPSDLPTLQFSLEEFEHEVDFLGGGHDWANALVEQLVIVRREWSTAYASTESGESAGATEHAGLALEALDKALDVECPTP